ncbi:ABC transporter substrate-binding protein/permease [Apilactobacillus apisilvae]|uniref:ABC transporter substrate-binding protein/permease n=1 Tax=Apilactobacillus apisilvae TaxID=2923364 RepID=A0ABY4PG10_9LACO|nr:ABC transporter substrate-binding protein/permease [Apilactobacillus apisilvae]UQS84740.1 ABC transporter substrate-binding protein/permease [Apilactobacillus apisilvae]
MKHFKFIAIIFIFFVGILGILGTENVHAASTNDNYLANIKKKGALVMGTSPDYPPYEFLANQNGQNKIEGADIQLGQQIAKNMGVKLQVKSMGFDSLLVGLQTNKVDMVIAGLNKTPQRAKSVSFSNSYYRSGTGLIINKNDKNKIKSYHDLKNKSVGAQVGSVQYDSMKKLPDVTTKGMENANDLIMALKTNKIAAVAMDQSVAQAYANHNSGIMTISSGLHSGDSDNNIAFAKGADSLVNSANKTISNLQKNNQYTKNFIPAAINKMPDNKNQSTANSMWQYKDFFIEGIKNTILISVIAVIFGIILGVIFALMRLSNNWLLHAIAVCYIEFIRGTPQLVQIMFVYFGLGAIVNVPALTAGIIAISINSGAYVAEIIRGGITSISTGQNEAALSLGLSSKQSMRYIVLPQAFKNIWPALGNELVTLIKDSSLASVIGVGELMYQMRAVQADSYKGVAPIAIIMVIYFVITFTISRIMKYFEGKFSHGTND